MNANPTFSTFDPSVIPWQDDVVDFLHNGIDWSKGVFEILLSGSVGSAKSTLLAHLIIKHCLENNGAKVLIGRRALPDLKRTIFSTILEHLDQPNMVGHYQTTNTTAHIYFPKTKSEIISASWADKRMLKFRSLTLSMAVFEELTENNEEEKAAYEEISMRVGRILHIKKYLIISATNPSGPQHWVYKRFIADNKPNRKVFYSVTEDNPFLPKSYIEKLKEDLDPLMAERMLYGKWVSISEEVIYYQYKRERNFIDKSYEINPYQDIHISWDFNIALGKPLSLCLFQFIEDKMHIFAEVIIKGADTNESCQELGMRGWLDHEVKYRLHGDATGGARSTKSKMSDYDIIDKFFANFRTKAGSPVDYSLEVPASNPPIRERHNLVNAYCFNAHNKCRLFVYKDCPTVDEGLRLTSLLKGSRYIEDDSGSKPYQHVTTALGYGLWWVNRGKNGASVSRRQIR